MNAVQVVTKASKNRAIVFFLLLQKPHNHPSLVPNLVFKTYRLYILYLYVLTIHVLSLYLKQKGKQLVNSASTHEKKEALGEQILLWVFV